MGYKGDSRVTIYRRNLQKDKKWNDNYVKNEYKNCKKAKNPSNKYSLSGIDVL